MNYVHLVYDSFKLRLNLQNESLIHFAYDSVHYVHLTENFVLSLRSVRYTHINLFIRNYESE